MSNKCRGTLTVLGLDRDVQNFKEFASKDDRCLSAANFIPYPEKYKDFEKVYHEGVQKRKSINEKFNAEGNNTYEIYDRGFEVTPEIICGYDEGLVYWLKENWYTNSGFCEPVIEEEDSELILYRFYTKWAPILPVIEKMGEMFKTLTFDYIYRYSNDVQYQGRFTMTKGSNTDNQCVDFSDMSINPPHRIGTIYW